MSAAADFMPMILDFMRDDPLSVQHIQSTQGTYDPATSEYTYTESITTCSAILLDMTRNLNGQSTKFGTDIIFGDKELYMLPPNRADSTAPQLVINTATDRIKVGNTLYKIEVMKEAKPDATIPLLYNFLLRLQS